MAATLDYLPLPVRLHSDVRSTVGLLDPENMGIAVEISLLSRLQAEIQILSFL